MQPRFSSEDQGFCYVSNAHALQAGRSHWPCRNACSVQYSDVSIREGMCDRKKDETTNVTVQNAIYQQETALLKHKRYLVILAVMLHLLLAWDG